MYEMLDALQRNPKGRCKTDVPSNHKGFWNTRTMFVQAASEMRTKARAKMGGEESSVADAPIMGISK